MRQRFRLLNWPYGWADWVLLTSNFVFLSFPTHSVQDVGAERGEGHHGTTWIWRNVILGHGDPGQVFGPPVACPGVATSHCLHRRISSEHDPWPGPLSQVFGPQEASPREAAS